MSRVVIAIALALVACHRRPDPALDRPLVLEVTAQRPGASAAQVARELATPLERALGKVPDLVRLSSVSVDGRAEITVVISADAEVLIGSSDVQEALAKAKPDLPADLVTQPWLAKRGELVARYLVADQARAEQLVEHLAATSGVAHVDECGARRAQPTIDVDPAALAAAGETVDDVVTAARSLHAVTPDALRAAAIGYANGAPIRLGDVARPGELALRDCRALGPAGDAIAIEVYAQPRVPLDELRARLARLTPEHPLAAMRELLVEPSDSSDDPERALAARLQGALGGTGSFVVEDGEHDVARTRVRVLLAGDDAAVAAATARLRAVPGVAAAGEPQLAIVLSSPDRAELVRATAALRARLGDSVVAVRGVADRLIAEVTLDRARAGELGASREAVTAAAGARTGLHVASAGGDVVVRVDAPPDRIYVHGASGLVPLAAVAAVTTRREPLEILHRGEFPAALVYLRGDRAAAQRALDGLGVHATVEAP